MGEGGRGREAVGRRGRFRRGVGGDNDEGESDV